MAEAFAQYSVNLEKISFKGTVDALRQYSAAIAQARNRKMRRLLWDDLLLNLVRDLVPQRPGRQEPRAVKRRPKPYPFAQPTTPQVCGNLASQPLLERPGPANIEEQLKAIQNRPLYDPFTTPLWRAGRFPLLRLAQCGDGARAPATWPERFSLKSERILAGLR